MANEVAYKQYNKRDRRAVLETDFSKGMMSTDGLVDEGYVKSLANFTFEKESRTITPRPGLNASRFIFIDDAESIEDEHITIKASKECLENGVVYNQNILGKTDSDSKVKGDIWLCTSLSEQDSTEMQFTEDYSDTVSFAVSTDAPVKHRAYFFTTGDTSVHKVPLSEDEGQRVETLIGSFAYGNNYYFFGEEEDTPGLFRTVFDTDHYTFEKVAPKELTVSEAVTYGYNMLLKDDTYVFSNAFGAPIIQLTGILPYASDTITPHTKLLMTPKKNQPIDLVCYFDGPSGAKYDFVWEWREVTASDWTFLKRQTGEVLSESTVLSYDYFQPPAKEIMVRVSAYPYLTLEGTVSNSASEDVEKAMVVGFDFTVENYGTANAVEQEVYDLTTATGMAAWNGRLVCWGVPKDPTILFISDYNEPSYFPYPNNIVVFDDPIIYAVEFMGNLAVFTTDKLYQVSLSDDGNSFTSTILQSHLRINPWDRHLIQTVRNMIYFKSGNYYYMMVPKAQSLTGELVLAPITTPITSFFDYFSANVQTLIKATYGFFDSYELITYYNYLDYDDIHNVYVYSFDDTPNVLHFDIIYNTADRTWKVWMYESSNILFPYRQDATQTGLLATTSLINVNTLDDSESTHKRIIQILKWDKLSVNECYIPSVITVWYIPDNAVPDFSGEAPVFPQDAFIFDEEQGATLIYPMAQFDTQDDAAIRFVAADELYAGLYKYNIFRSLIDVYNHSEDYYTFGNYQFLDTGYRNDALQYKKRYRELQLQINNLDKRDLSFGMEYILDGAPRKLLYKYEVTQLIDEFQDDYGVVYIDTVPYMEVKLDDIDLSNQWTIDQGLHPEVSLWKIRVSVSGKGSAPRFKLYSRNNKRFELIGINWISKIMHMR